MMRDLLKRLATTDPPDAGAVAVGDADSISCVVRQGQRGVWPSFVFCTKEEHHVRSLLYFQHMTHIRLALGQRGLISPTTISGVLTEKRTAVAIEPW